MLAENQSHKAGRLSHWLIYSHNATNKFQIFTILYLLRIGFFYKKRKALEYQIMFKKTLAELF